MIRVLIADDHAIVRAGLKQVLASTADMVVAGEACDGLEVLEQIRKSPWDAIVLDMSMPGLSGIDLIKRIRKEKPSQHVLVLSMHQEDQFAIRALKAGASGYVTKGSAPDVLIAAIRRVAAGGKHISRSLAEKLALELDPFEKKPVSELLSDREHQVLGLIVAGRSINEIGSELSISPNTVSTHKHRLMKKLNVRNNAELMQYAIGEHLFD
jgi:DNA-binding NarL/FixJ family response regulator